jgi:5-methyltetrahydrofolate--homocysteine methyltransferase
VVGFWPANSDGDDVVVWTDETRTTELTRLHTLRQQMSKGEGGRANVALSDFIAPIGERDWIGGFAVTAGHGEPEIAKAFKDKGDDYSAILAAALADRLAEAFAEAMHRKVRTELWGYAPDEPFDIEALIGEKYRGIRPAAGYPAQPDHTEKAELFRILDAPAQTGMALTESFAMNPPASRVGPVLRPPRGALFRRRADREGPGRGLCAAQGLGPGDRRALAGPDPQLRAGEVGATLPPRWGKGRVGGECRVME